MKRMSVVAFTILALMGASYNAAAQEVPGAGRAEIGIFPVGGFWFTQGSRSNEVNGVRQPKFKDYQLGLAGTYNANRLFGLEGEFGAGLGLDQNVTVNDVTFSTKVPKTYTLNGNLLYNPWGSDTRWVPYVTAGVGALTFRRQTNADRLGGVFDRTTFFSQNFGGGVKWFTASNWGLRGDYRFFVINGKSDVNPLFTQGNNENRFGNRVYGSFVLTY
jgi:hypothetical protein